MSLTLRPREMVIMAATAVVVALFDLGTKRWAQQNLATPEHLLPVVVSEGATGNTVAEVLSNRFGRVRSDVPVYRLDTSRTFAPDAKVFEKGVLPDGSDAFVVFPKGRVSDGYARVVPRNQDRKVAGWLALLLPKERHHEIARTVREALGDVTIVDFLTERVPELNREEVLAILPRAVFAFGTTKDRVALTQSARPGDVYLLGYRAIEIVPEHLDLSYAENPAGAWGMLSGSDPVVRSVLFFVLSIVAMAAVIYFMLNPPSHKPYLLVSLGAVLGGAIGNVVDRLTLGYVVDFIHMYWEPLHWPRYNVADAAITVGVLVLLAVSWGSSDQGAGSRRPSGG